MRQPVTARVVDDVMKVFVAARARGVLIIAGMFGYVVRKIAHTAVVVEGPEVPLDEALVV